MRETHPLYQTHLYFFWWSRTILTAFTPLTGQLSRLESSSQVVDERPFVVGPRTFTWEAAVWNLPSMCWLMWLGHDQSNILDGWSGVAQTGSKWNEPSHLMSGPILLLLFFPLTEGSQSLDWTNLGKTFMWPSGDSTSGLNLWFLKWGEPGGRYVDLWL